MEKQIVGILNEAEGGAVVTELCHVRDELLNETLFFTIGQARSILARWVDDRVTERPHASLGYATPATFAADLEQQRAGLIPPVASSAFIRDDTGEFVVAAG